MIILPSKFGYKTVQPFTTFPKIIRLQNVALNKLPNYGIFKKTGYLASEEQGQIKGEGAGVCTPSPLTWPAAFWYNWYSVLKFVYVSIQLRHFLVMHSLLRKIFDLSLRKMNKIILNAVNFCCLAVHVCYRALQHVKHFLFSLPASSCCFALPSIWAQGNH